jgi:hypothetical protein
MVFLPVVVIFRYEWTMLGRIQLERQGKSRTGRKVYRKTLDWHCPLEKAAWSNSSGICRLRAVLTRFDHLADCAGTVELRSFPP